MISDFVAKFLRHVATGGPDGVAGNSALGRCVFTKHQSGFANMYNQGLGMIAAAWTTRLQNKGYVKAWMDEHGHTHVRITKAGQEALKEYDSNGQAN